MRKSSSSFSKVMVFVLFFTLFRAASAGAAIPAPFVFEGIRIAKDNPISPNPVGTTCPTSGVLELHLNKPGTHDECPPPNDSKISWGVDPITPITVDHRNIGDAPSLVADTGRVAFRPKIESGTDSTAPKTTTLLIIDAAWRDPGHYIVYVRATVSSLKKPTEDGYFDPATSPPYPVSVDVVKCLVTGVNFAGDNANTFFDVLNDSGNPYSGQNNNGYYWRDNSKDKKNEPSPNGNASDAGDFNTPLCYLRGSKIKISKVVVAEIDSTIVPLFQDGKQILGIRFGYGQQRRCMLTGSPEVENFS